MHACLLNEINNGQQNPKCYWAKTHIWVGKEEKPTKMHKCIDMCSNETYHMLHANLLKEIIKIDLKIKVLLCENPP
jgi:hypothetical protein